MTKQKYSSTRTDDVPFPDKTEPLPPAIRPDPVSKFCAGDTVYLKSGSGRMTIERLERIGGVDTAHCVYCVYGTHDIRRASVNIVALKHA